jgi:hypothetical protein
MSISIESGTTTVDSDPLRIATLAVSRYRRGMTSFPNFVIELERAVYEAEERADSRAMELRRIWGQLEIVNALALDEGVEISSSDREVDGLIAHMLDALGSPPPGYAGSWPPPHWSGL